MTAAPRVRLLRPQRYRRYSIALLGALGLLLLFVPTVLRLLAEWPWFASLGYGRVFATELIAKVLLGVTAAVIAFAFLYGNIRFALRGLVPDPLVIPLGEGGTTIDLTRLFRQVALPASAVVALIFAVAAAAGWLDVLNYLHRTPFGVRDPIFGRDIAYYVFALPVVQGVLAFGTTLATLALFGVAPLYILRRDIVVFRRTVTVEPSARWHLAALVSLLFLLAAARVYLVRLPGLLYAPEGLLTGATYADLHAAAPALRAAGIVALAAAVFVLWGARGHQLARNTLLGIAAYFGVILIGTGVYPAAIQRLVVAPNELARESTQLAYHIAATRTAWGLDRVVTRDLSGESGLTERDIRANGATIENVRLWDRDPLLQTFGQLQEIRTYYDFIAVDDDRYRIDGRYRQVLLSPRELNPGSLPTRTFINERLTFTHGMGLTLSPVNEVTGEGLPVLFIKDLPPVSSVSLAVTRPEIYFGEMSDTWVFANTRQREFDYPSGEQNIFTAYEGTGGVPVDSWFRRLVLAAHFRSLKVLLSSDITNESRALYVRNIRRRAQTALPFLLFDGDPYIVIDGSGRLRWVLDAYTAASRYPYAQQLSNGINYMRNSVKVVIDAYDGSVTAYLADPADPLVRTLDNAFPGILRPLAEMPADLRAHLRYPEDLFRIQTDLYGIYHMAEPDIFYHREDQWQKPVLARRTEREDPFLRHIVMRLPGEPDPEFILMVPFTPRGKDNLASWMVARNDGERYGELVVYRFPKQSLVFGPAQVVNRINQDTEIARQVSLWDQRGSQVIRGNLLVIPIEESLIYVQPLYLQAEGGRIPELKRVVVAYQNRVLMDETLDAGLARLFGPGAATAPPRIIAEQRAAPVPAAAGGRAPDLAREASAIYQRALSAQRSGDWARYGEELHRLGTLLRQIEEALNAGGPSR
jgi:uncharacterized membrane protein (UPF0182 family)